MLPHQFAAILATSRLSRRQARALCNTHGLGGGAGDLARVLQSIEAHPQRAEIHRLAAIAAVGRDDPSRQPQATILWLHPAQDHAAWLAAGLGDWPTHAAYAERITTTACMLRTQGVRVEVRRTPVAAFLELLASKGLDPTNAQHRAAAIGMIPPESPS